MNTKKLLLVAGGVALAWWLWKKSQDGRSMVRVTDSSGKQNEVPAWFPGQTTVTRKDGTKVITGPGVPDAYYDMDQYGGEFVGPRFDPNSN